MKILISTDLDAFRATAGESAYVRLQEPDSDLSAPLTGPEAASIWICSGREATDELLSSWLNATSSDNPLLLVRDPAELSRLRWLLQGQPLKIAEVPHHLHPSLPWAESVLRTAEMIYSGIRAQAGYRSTDVPPHQGDDREVLLVGAGIVNLIAAEYLAARGFKIRVIEASPDPRTCKDWTRLGVTHGGGNARMFTRTEADNYNEKGSKIYQNMKSVFRRTTRNGGWSVKAIEKFSAAELAWVDAFEQLPAWLARSFREDIFEVNNEAGNLWEDHMRTAPDLYEDVGFCRDILRVYAEEDALHASVLLHHELGAMRNDTSPREFLKTHPGFISAFQSDDLAGGFTVEGFTVNIHLFVGKLISRIVNLGGEFHWNCKAELIRRNEMGQVTGLESPIGFLTADHYVVSPGMTGNALLRGTSSENLLQGVLGVWLQIPNLEPRLENSMKIHRRGHLVEDINVTVGKDPKSGADILILGGGYGYVGLDRPASDSPELTALFDELEEVARIYFPRGHAMGKNHEALWPDGNYKFCVRPFTSTGLGVFETIPTANGGSLIITGGNNTGGFTQAPALARAVMRAFEGECDPIHVLFHPDRGRLSKPGSTEIRHEKDPVLRALDTDSGLDAPMPRAVL